MPSRRFVVAYWAWFVLLAAIFVTVRPAQSGVIAAAGVSGAGAIVYGVCGHRPLRRWPWYCLAAALLLSAAAEIITRVIPGPVATYRPGSPVLYGVLFVMSVFLVAGVVGLARFGPRDLIAVIDIAVLLLGTGLLVGVLLAVPYALTPDLPAIQATARVFSVARDVLVFALFVHVSTSERWNRSMALLFGGAGAFFAYDLALRLGLIHGVVLQGTAVELGWFLFAAAWGMAALLPTMRYLSEPRAQPRRSTPVRLALLAVASVLPFALLIAATFERTRQWYEPYVATGSLILLALVLVQLVGVASGLRNQVRAEQALSRSVSEIAAASSREDVAAALEAGVPLLSTGRATGSLAAAVAYDGDHRELLPPGVVETRLGLGPLFAFPLCADDQDSGLVLYLRGGGPAVDRLRPRLEVLATQACQALERIRLSGELVRRNTQGYVDAVAHTGGDVILLVDDDDRVALASRSADALFGPSTIVGARLTDLFDESVRDAVTHLLRRARERESPVGDQAARRGGPRDAVAPPANVAAEPGVGVDTSSWSMRRGDGTQAELEVACRRVASADLSVRGLLVDLRDVTEQRRLERDLTERAARDQLTGLVSGHEIREGIREGIEAHRDSLIAMIVLDLNDFKLVNNHFGHDVGDAVLRTIADRLAAAAHPDGLAGRVAGDHFAVAVNVAAPDDADHVAAGLLAAVAQPIKIRQAIVTCTASAGIATTAEPVTPEELARRADLALLIAKDEGRGQWHHYDPTARSMVMERLEMREALEQALDNHALALVYQPIVDLETGSVAGFEALLRWHHPTYGQLSPPTFVDVAEESKLILPIGDWILERALRDAHGWDAVAPEAPPYIAVNVTPTELEAPGFCAGVRRKLAASGLAAPRLHLEITESRLLGDSAIWRDLQRLRQTGIVIAIDDFGTGYSALSYLGHVPADRIKLDRQFVASATVNRTQRDLAEGIVRLARILGLDVIAEGVETTEQRDIVAELGCRFGQGYLFARPMPAEATVPWLAEQRHRAGQAR